MMKKKKIFSSYLFIQSNLKRQAKSFGREKICKHARQTDIRSEIKTERVIRAVGSASSSSLQHSFVDRAEVCGLDSLSTWPCYSFSLSLSSTLDSPPTSGPAAPNHTL